MDVCVVLDAASAIIAKSICFIRYFEVNTLNYVKCDSNTTMIA